MSRRLAAAPRRVVASVTAAVALVVSAVVTARAVATYRHVDAAFHGARGPIPKPETLASILRDVRLLTAAHTPIGAWYLPPRNGAVVVFVHGSYSDRRGLLSEAEALAAAGYGAVLLDTPGHGESGGRTTWGTDDQNAVTAAIDFVSAQGDVRGGRIGAFGFSMGSSVVAHAAAADRRIGAVVLSGAFTTIEEQLAFEFRTWGPVTHLPAVWAARRDGLAFDALRSVDVVDRIAPRPLLVVAGDADTVVPLPMARTLFDRAGAPKELFVVRGANHGGYGAAAGEAYYARVVGFFDRAFGMER